MIEELKKYAIDNNIPIIEDDISNYLISYIKNNNVTNILEIGSAIGYSAIVMANASDIVKISTIERDEDRFKLAQKNVKDNNLTTRIELYLADALEFDCNLLNKQYDLIFIDAAKAQSQKFFEKYAPLLSSKGVIVIDNINFHGFANGVRLSKNRNTRQLVRKINDFKAWLVQNDEYLSEYHDIGDGILLAKRND